MPTTDVVALHNPTHLLKVVRDVLIPPLTPHNAGCLSPETVLAKLEERRSGIP